MSEKIRVLRIHPAAFGGDLILPLNEAGINVALEELRESEPGDEWTFTPDEMDENEFKNLPEHQGW